MVFDPDSLNGVYKPRNRLKMSMGFISERLSGSFKLSNRLNWSLSGVFDLETETEYLKTT